MPEIDAMIPRCSHGKIILGCPHDDCPEQQEYIGKHNKSVQEFLDRQKADARAFVREYLGMPPEVIIPGELLDLSFVMIEETNDPIPTPGEGSTSTE